jgi:adenylate cyclase
MMTDLGVMKPLVILSFLSCGAVIAAFSSDNGVFPEPTGVVTIGDEPQGISTNGYIPNVERIREVSSEGFAVAPVDVDNLVRRLPLLFKIPDGWVPSFSTQVLKSLVGSDTFIIKGNEITVQGLPPVPVDTLGRKWVSWVDTPQTTLTEMQVDGTFVFVGVTARGVMPQLATPVGLLEPHKIQAALAESILIQDSPLIPDYSLAAEVGVFVLSVSLTWLFITYFGINLGLFSASVGFAAQSYAMVWLIHKGLLIDLVWSLISTFIVGATAFYLNFRQQFKLRQQIKKQFEHYLDPRQVKRLQKNPELLKLGGEKRRCTFLFTDVRGFTALSESVEPEQVVYIMNKVLTAQQSAVQEFGGMVDKYIGDAMMAIFNAPIDMKGHEMIAVECALRIKENVAQTGRELEAEGLPSIAIGIGVNTGEAIIGNMGSATRFDYTAIGDAVNTAARLESATKAVGVDILIGLSTQESCRMPLRELEPILVKGKEKALRIFAP